MPWKSEDATLATPCAMKSRLMLDRDRSGLGATSLTPAPWTRTITAMAAASVSIESENTLRSGSAGNGRPVGMPPPSLTWATSVRPTTITTIVGTTSARRALILASGVLAQPTRMARASNPIAADQPVIAPGSVRTDAALAIGTEP